MTQTPEIIDVLLPLYKGSSGIDIGETFGLEIPEENINGETYRCTEIRYAPRGIMLGAKNESAFADDPSTINTTISNQQADMNEVKRR